MKYISIFITVLFISFACTNGVEKREIIDNSFSTADKQLRNMLNEIPAPIAYPRTMNKNGELVATPLNDWTEGFFPGCLWYMYENTNDNFWKENAVKWTENLEPMKYTKHHHDVGFIMYCSFGNAYRLTQNEKYKDVLIESANSLCTRYNENVGSIESWNYRKAWNGRDEWFYPVIIDNMMNLELLYFATKVTGNTNYAKIATRHAETTLKNHFREDFSTYHVVNYDTVTGNVLHRATCQGFSDNSTWARGQAWAIYSFTMVYRETKNPVFLDAAIKSADFWLNHPNLPNDMIPYWDFDAGKNGFVPDWDYNESDFEPVPRDASAAAITAAALFELADYSEKKDYYYKAAEKTLASLSSKSYLAQPGENANFILMHSVGSIPHKSEIDVPIVYADYYYLEALTRYKNSKK